MNENQKTMDSRRRSSKILKCSEREYEIVTFNMLKNINEKIEHMNKEQVIIKNDHIHLKKSKKELLEIKI